MPGALGAPHAAPANQCDGDEPTAGKEWEAALETPVDLQDYSATLTSALPKFSPRISLQKASGADSSPSPTSSR